MITRNVQSTQGSPDATLTGIVPGNLLTVITHEGVTPSFSAGTWALAGTASNPSGPQVQLYYCLSAPSVLDGEITVTFGVGSYGSFQESSGAGAGTWALADHDEVATGFGSSLVTKTFTFVADKDNLLIGGLAPYRFSALDYTAGAGLTLDEVIGSSGFYITISESGVIVADAAVSIDFSGNSTGGLIGAQFTFTPTLTIPVVDPDSFELIDATRIAFELNPGTAPSGCAVQPLEATVTDQAGDAGETVADGIVENGTTNPQRGTLTLTNGVPPGVTIGLDLATGFIVNTLTDENSASGSVPVTNSNPTAEDISAKVTFIPTPPHDLDIVFDPAGTMVEAYLPILTQKILRNGVAYSGEGFSDGDLVDYSWMTAEGVTVAAAATYTYGEAAPVGNSRGSGLALFI